MRALLQIPGNGIVVCPCKLASEITFPRVKQLAIFGYQHVNIEAFPVGLLHTRIEMPASFRGLILDQRPVRQHGTNVIAISHDSGRFGILIADSLEKADREIMGIAVDVHGVPSDLSIWEIA